MNKLLLLSTLLILAQPSVFSMMNLAVAAPVATKELFFAAVRYGSLEAVQLMLAEKIDVNTVDKDNRTALHYAAQGDDVSLVERLLKHGANAAMQDRFKRTPLHYAASQGSSEIVKELLDSLKIRQNAISCTDWEGRTALHLAAIRGNPRVVSEFLAVRAYNEDRDASESTPIDWAVAYDHNAVVKRFLATINITDYRNCRSQMIQRAVALLDRPVFQGSMQCIIEATHDLEELKVLIAANLTNIDAVDCYKRTLLHYAVGGQWLELVDLIIATGADVNAPDERELTPLHLACQSAVSGQSSTKIVSALLTAGAHVHAKDETGSTPLHRAAEKGHADIVKLLLQAKASVDAKDQNLRTPLHRAAHGSKLIAITGKEADLNRYALVAMELLKHKASSLAMDRYLMTPLQLIGESPANPVFYILLVVCDPNNRGSKGSTALCYVKDPQVAQLLIARGAAVNTSNEFGRTPLHYAAAAGLADVVLVLLDAGARQSRDLLGNTPLHEAACCVCEAGKYQETIQLLLDRGASKTAQNAYRQIARDRAVDADRPTITKLLQP